MSANPQKSFAESLLRVLNEEADDEVETKIPAKGAGSENDDEARDEAGAKKASDEVRDRQSGKNKFGNTSGEKDEDDEQQEVEEEVENDLNDDDDGATGEDGMPVDDVNNLQVRKEETGDEDDDEDDDKDGGPKDDLDEGIKLREGYGDEELKGMSDPEIMRAAYQEGVEDSIVKDGEGGLANREEMEKILRGITTEGVDLDLDDEDNELDDDEDADGSTPDDGEDGDKNNTVRKEERNNMSGDDDDDEDDEEGAPKDDVKEEAIPDNRGKGETPEQQNRRIRANGTYDETDNKHDDEDGNKTRFDDIAKQTLGQGAEEDAGAAEENDRIKRNYRNNERPAGDRPPGYDVHVNEDHLKALFGNETLTEDFKSRAATIFEAAVKENVKVLSGQLKEHYTKVFSRKLREEVNGLVDKLDGYLGVVAEAWMKQNEIALESGMRAQVTESFVRGLKAVFEQHQIELPEEKVDVVRSLKAKTRKAIAKLNETTDELVAARRTIADLSRKEIVREASEGLTQSQAEKLVSLVEGVEFTDAKAFASKVKVIKESYFSKPATRRGSAPVDPVKNTTDGGVISEDVQSAVAAITKLIR